MSHWSGLAVWVLIAAYFVFFATLTVKKHNAFQTTAFDLGNVDQAVWNTRHGRPLAMTNIEGLTNRLGTHVEPVLLPISLLYFLWSDPRALLLLQAATVGLGAWPIYLITRLALTPSQDRTASHVPYAAQSTQQILPLTLSTAYLLFPALQSANAFDFHAVALAPTFFLWAFYCLETERWGCFALFSLLTMSCKEDMPLLVALLGLYALLAHRKWRVGLVTMAVSLAWFWAAVSWIMPHFDTQGISPLAGRYTYLGNGPVAMAITLLTRPGLVIEHLRAASALAYLRNLLAPVGFLSLLAPQVLILAVPTLALNLLSTDGFMHALEGFHYGAPLAPIVVVSAAHGAAWLIRRLPRTRPLPLLLAALILGSTLAYHRAHGYTPLAANFQGMWPVVTEHHLLGQALARSLPREASLAALPYLNPHASQRQRLTMIDRVENGLPAPLHDADYVWLDVTNGWPLHPNDLKAGVENLLNHGYGLEQAVDGWLLLRRGAAAKQLPDAFYRFARTSEPRPQYPMRLQFLLDGEPILECLGVDLNYNRWTADYRLTLYWRAIKPLPAGLRLYPFYFDDASGQVIEDTTLRPMIATVWYPPERWQAGEIVRTDTLPWAVGSDFSVGLGVVREDAWSHVDSRLPLRVESSESVIRLFDGNTWARLLHVQDNRPLVERRSFARPSPQHPLDASFGGEVRLLGYDLNCRSQPGSCLVRLYWQAQRRLDTSYTIFAQVLDPDGKVGAQVDALPHGGGYLTVWWLPGEVVAESLALHLPANVPPEASYRLIVGLYNATTGTRLPVEGTGTDFMELTALRMR